METPIVVLKPGPNPLHSKNQLGPTPPAPKRIDKTAFPKKTPRGTQPANRKLGRRQPSNKRTSRSASIEVSPVNQPRPPRVSADLERRFQALERSQRNLVQPKARTWDGQECLTVSLDSSGQYWITVRGTGEPFIRKPFAQSEYCIEAVLELEEAFDILQAIELRPPEMIERIEEIVKFYLERERVLQGCG